MRGPKGATPCSVAGCATPSTSKGLCRTHYSRASRGADLDAPIRRLIPGSECLFVGCWRAATHTGFCVAHARQVRNGLPLSPLGTNVKARKYGFSNCTLTGCLAVHYSSGLCQAHYNKGKKYKLSCLQLDALCLTEACPICLCTLTPATLVLDHDHSCCSSERNCGYCLRGVLCNRCNVALGMLMDSPAAASRAAAYLS